MRGEFISVCRVPENPGVLRAARPSSTSRLLSLTLSLISSFNFLQLGKTMERRIKGPHEGPECSRQQKQKLLKHTHTFSRPIAFGQLVLFLNALMTQVTYGGFLLRGKLFTRKHFKDATFVSKGDKVEWIQIWFYRFSCHILTYMHTEARKE